MEKAINRITADPAICNGRPVIRGMRISVSSILEYLAAGETTDNILQAYPSLEKEDIQACLDFAKSITDKSILNYDLQSK
ncbi:MAG: DUF433 domain-containing protein [Bacteroidales bacterium]|nr:DUF433 domain-containing protein [Bacteroidales bacterium]